jgi:hypothetical protein
LLFVDAFDKFPAPKILSHRQNKNHASAFAPTYFALTENIIPHNLNPVKTFAVHCSDKICLFRRLLPSTSAQ